MVDMPVDLVVFDLTGTTVRDNGVMEGALRDSLSRHGISFSDEDIMSMRGGSKTAAFNRLAMRAAREPLGTDTTEGIARELYSTFKEELRRGYSEGPLAETEGAGESMRWLKDQGVKLAATTALDVDIRDIVLGRLGWKDGLFDSAVSNDQVPAGRPAPYMIHRAMMECGVLSVARVAVVGDTPLDLQAGTNAGAGWIIGVLCGVYGVEVLGMTRHTHLLKSPGEIRRLFGG